MASIHYFESKTYFQGWKNSKQGTCLVNPGSTETAKNDP